MVGIPSDPAARTTFFVGRATHGDAEALAWVVERFSPLLLAQARYRLGARLAREVDPEDVVSDVWLSVLPRLSEFADREGRRTPVILRFLSTAVLNRVNNLVARTLRRNLQEAAVGAMTDGPPEPPAEITGAFSHCARGDACTRMLEAIQALPDSDRSIIVLRGIEQRPNGEAAELLGIEANTATVRYGRALSKLRAALPGSLLDEV